MATRKTNLRQKLLYSGLVLYFVVQIVLPWRYLAYPGNLFWTEEGYRFSWRVMLMEKAGYVVYYVKDSTTGKKKEVLLSKYLSKTQQKVMATQPDMLLQFAHFLADTYAQKGIKNPQVYVDCYVTLNAYPSRLLIDPTIDLTQQHESFYPKTWLLPFETFRK